MTYVGWSLPASLGTGFWYELYLVYKHSIGYFWIYAHEEYMDVVIFFFYCCVLLSGLGMTVEVVWSTPSLSIFHLICYRTSQKAWIQLYLGFILVRCFLLLYKSCLSSLCLGCWFLLDKTVVVWLSLESYSFLKIILNLMVCQFLNIPYNILNFTGSVVIILFSFPILLSWYSLFLIS